jgi:tripartite-type tricarboxylate transporter receptor subunit TctC
MKFPGTDIAGTIAGELRKEERVKRIKKLLALSSCSLLLALGVVDSSSQGYPAKPVRFIVPFSPGGGADTTARLIAPHVSETLGQRLVIDNRGGAGGTIGASLAARAAPDGYTIVLGTANIAASVSLFDNLTFDPLKDFAAVALLAKAPSVIAVHPSLPVTSVAQLITLARAHPGKINYAGGTVGSLLHLDAEYFKTLAKIDMVRVPYNSSGPSMIGIVTGEASVVISPALLVLPHARSGRLRALAIATDRRTPAMPDLPTVAESGLPGYEAAQWYGILVPAGTPEPVVTRLNGEFVRAVQAPALTSRLQHEASIPIGSTPQEFAGYLKNEIAKWAKVVKVSAARAQ